jgi:FKBP-type peptidyl-prolyl cis-trans isomerase
MHVNDHSVHSPVPLDSQNTEDAAAAAAATLPRSFRRSTQTTTMGVTKDTVKPGDGSTFPQKGQRVTVHYTGARAQGEAMALHSWL